MIGSPSSAMSACIAALEGFNASIEAPRADMPVPDRYVRASRVGGGMMNPVTDAARVLVECWAPTNLEAETLCNQARFALLNSSGKTLGGTFVRWCKEVSGPVDFPDSVGPRYQFVVELLAATS